MGRWAQARKRGSDNTAAAAVIPSPPDAGEWLWEDTFDGQGVATFSGIAPDGVIGWQLWAHNGIVAYAYADQDPGGFGNLLFTGPTVPFVQCFGKVRYIISGAGIGDPGSVYSEFSAEKDFTP